MIIIIVIIIIIIIIIVIMMMRIIIIIITFCLSYDNCKVYVTVTHFFRNLDLEGLTRLFLNSCRCLEHFRKFVFSNSLVPTHAPLQKIFPDVLGE